MPGVKADILAKVVQFMQHHRGVEPPILEKPLRSKVKHKQHTTQHTQTEEQQSRADRRTKGMRGRWGRSRAVGLHCATDF